MRFSILGPVEITTDAGPLPVKNGRERFVLALLLLSADRLTPTDRIIDALWEEPPPTARAQLHNIVGSLRRRLRPAAGDLIVTRPLGYEFRLGDHALDLLEFRRLVARGRQAAVEGDAAQAADTFDAALALWRGPALTDVDDRLASRPRAALDDERATAAEDLLKARLELGQADRVLDLLPALAEAHPHRERLYEMQMRALAATGRRADALETYQHAYQRLVDDLGVEPGPVLRELEQQVLQGVEVAPTAPTVVTPRQLPAMLTTLTGRDGLVKEVGGALVRAGSGPTTALLVGPGGIGKTTLATAVGHGVSNRFPDGQLYADLRGAHAGPAEPHDVLAAFLRALGASGSEVPDNTEERAALYRSLLADKRTLILLDDAADESQVRPLLPGSADCAVIVTSRQRLNALLDTSRWTVPGLRSSDAVDLVGRIVGRDRVGVEPEAAASVVAACGHLPLAVSIAAARLAAREEWTLAEYAERLADERRRLDELRLGDLDVRASIALSYQALDPNHRRLLRRLGLVSTPDWPTWVAHEVADDLDARDVETALDRLTDAHLIEPLGRDPVGQIRFRLHDLVAEYAHERALAEETGADRTDVVARVLSGWLALATEADRYVEHGTATVGDGMTPPEPPRRATLPGADTATSWFETERVNLVIGVAEAGQIANADLTAGLAIRLSGFLRLRAHTQDRLRCLDLARAAARTAGRDDLLERVLRLLFSGMIQTSTPADLDEVATETLAVARRLGEPASIARACISAGLAMWRRGHLAAAERWLNEGVAAAEPVELPELHAVLWHAVASVHMKAGRVAAVLAPMERAVDIQRRSGRSHQLAICLSNYGEALLANSRLPEAESVLEEAIQLAADVGNRTSPAWSECTLAEIAIRRGAWSAAATHLDAARSAHETANTVDGLAEVKRVLGELALATGRPDDALDHLDDARQIWQELRWPIDLARTLARLELAHRATGDPRAAEECRAQWQGILDDLELDDACLLLPPFLTAG